MSCLRHFLVFCAVLAWLPSFAQSEKKSLFPFPSQLPEEYRIDPKSMYDSIRRIDDLSPDTIPRDQVKKFAAQQSYGLNALFRNGTVYPGWNGMETYLNDVFDKTVPERILERGNAKVYPATWTGWNARVFFDGTTLMDVGFFAELENEAELAFILGHEAVHFQKRDVAHRFWKNVDKEARRERKWNYQKEQIRDALRSAAYSRADERVADSIGVEYALEAGYGIEHGIDLFERIRHYKELFAKSDSSDVDSIEYGDVKKPLDGLLSSHPDLEDRIEALKRFRRKQEKESKAFQVDRSRFKELRKKARRETVRMLVRRGDFKKGVMRGFKYHLLAPDDPLLMEYLLKAMRRALFVDEEMADKGFLHWVHPDPENQDFCILDDLHYLIGDSSRFQRISAKSYLQDSGLFRTNGEAYEHLVQKAMDMDLAHAFLAKAIDAHLDSTITKEERDRFLQKYLDRVDDGASSSFAKALKAERLSEAAPQKGKEFLSIDGLKLIHDQRYGFRRMYLKEDRKSSAYIEGLHKLVEREFPSKDLKISYSPAHMKENFSEQLHIKRIRLSIFQYMKKLFGKAVEKSVTKKENPLEEAFDDETEEERRDSTLFMLAPEHWSFFQENGITSLGFLYGVGLDDRIKRKKSFYDIFNPWIYVSAPWRFNAAFMTGADRFTTEVGYIRYAPWEKERLIYHIETSPYPMRKNNFLNSVYYAIGSATEW